MTSLHFSWDVGFKKTSTSSNCPPFCLQDLVTTILVLHPISTTQEWNNTISMKSKYWATRMAHPLLTTRLSAPSSTTQPPDQLPQKFPNNQRPPWHLSITWALLVYRSLNPWLGLCQLITCSRRNRSGSGCRNQLFQVRADCLKIGWRNKQKQQQQQQQQQHSGDLNITLVQYSHPRNSVWWSDVNIIQILKLSLVIL